MFYVITFLILWCGFGLYLLDTEKNPKRMNLDDLKDKLKDINDYVYISYDEENFDNIEKSKVNFEKVIHYTLNLEPTRVELVDANYLKRTEAEERNNL